MELEYGLGLARGIVHKLQPVCDVERDFQRVIESGTREGRFAGQDRRPPEPHVCCFAAPIDGPNPTETNTALWAMYGRNGAGFVLAFDGEALAQLALVDFFPVSYEPSEQRARLEAVIRIAKETAMAAHNLALRKGTDGAARYMMAVSAHAFGSILAMHSAGMKGPRHDFEREWRMMYSYMDVEPVGEQLVFRVEASGPLLRSYYERPFPKSTLRAVIVGAKHYDLNEFVVSALLKDHQYENAEVRRGEVNIRGAEGT